MKAIICTKYGPANVLKLQAVEKSLPKKDEVLVKVHAASVTAADVMMRKGIPRYARIFLGLFRPKIAIPGTGFAGEVEAVGSDVGSFKPGEHVFGEVLFSPGTYAEYVCVPQAGLLFRKPSAMTCSQAAPVCDGALTSMNFLRDVAKLKKGQRILVNGASGSLGTSAVQLAKYFGAHVTGVCSTRNIELVSSLGADNVIDYTKEQFNQNGETYDVIYDTVGKLSYSQCKDSLSSNGVFVSPVLSLRLLLNMIWTSMFNCKKAKFSATGIRPISELRELLSETCRIIESGGLRSVLDLSFELSQTSDAHRYVEKGHKTGNVTLSIQATAYPV